MIRSDGVCSSGFGRRLDPASPPWDGTKNWSGPGIRWITSVRDMLAIAVDRDLGAHDRREALGPAARGDSHRPPRRFHGDRDIVGKKDRFGLASDAID